MKYELVHALNMNWISYEGGAFFREIQLIYIAHAHSHTRYNGRFMILYEINYQQLDSMLIFYNQKKKKKRRKIINTNEFSVF